jgi:AraC-like DNA-binding protein
LADPVKTIRIATDAIPRKDRVEVAREIFGRQMLRMEADETPEMPFYCDLTVQVWPGMATVTGAVKAERVARTKALLNDGNDDLILTINQSNAFRVFQRKTNFVLRNGDAVVCSCAEQLAFERPNGNCIGLRIPRAALAKDVPDIDDTLNRLIPSNNHIVVLLRGYLEIFENGPTETSPELAQLAVRHVHDLLALSLGARRDFQEVAKSRGLAAARLRAIKASIVRDCLRHDLSVTMIAAQHRMTPRHVQRLFENDGSTFSQFLLAQRLSQAHAALTDPQNLGKRIGEIIFASGFGDISYFNRAFRARYGGSPSEIRHHAITQIASANQPAK